jgi:hypothetical protein
VSRIESADQPASVPDKKPRGALSRRKKWAFRFLLVLVLIPIIELISWLGLRLSQPNFSFRTMYLFQNQTAETGVAPGTRGEVIHPYLGWCLNPETQPQVEIAGHSLPVNQLGFVDEGPTLVKRSPDRLIVGIVGGSVAQQLSILGEATLRQRLAESAQFRGKKIELLRLAFSGFKQPQQLMAIAYVLSLGGELDVLVNIDGFNEIALAPCENEKWHVFAAYPRMWNTLTMNSIDPREYVPAFRLLEVRARRQQAARAIVDSPLRYSPTRNLIWKIEDTYFSGQLAALATETSSARDAQSRGYEGTGPPQLFTDRTRMLEHLVAIWGDSSRQINSLCRGNGITYVHILQPNQYVRGSKPLSKAESELWFLGREEACYKSSVENGYQALMGEGKKLRAAGVDFHDLTQLFAGISDQIYADTCCHYNQRGNDLLAGAIADAILAAPIRSGPGGTRAN